MRRKLLVLVSTSALTFTACNCGKTNGLLETSGLLGVTPAGLEFGQVTEFTQKTLKLSLENTGRGALTIGLSLEADTSSEFTLGVTPVELASGGKVDVDVTFAALGAGEDTGAIVITSDEPDRGPVRVPLHAGGIFPRLAFEPDPLAFAPAASNLVMKQAVLRNVGGATLHVNAIGVNPSGSSDFSVTPPVLPLSLAPDASVPVSVSYARSLNQSEGLLQVVSDEPLDGGDRQLRLLPDPARVCGDGIDNDNDGLIDFPDDVGCTSAEDGDEFNSPECVTGGTQPCGSTTGSCRAGSRVCANSIWGACDGGVRAGTERCNGQDDDCNGMSDENLSELCTVNGCSGARACVPNSGTDGGLFTACIPINSTPEVCNGLDDNCNGVADEGVVQTCALFGCAGVRICVPGSDGGFTSCQPTNPLPELCNGIDDDCDGVVDDAPDLVCGIGPCRRVVPACVNGQPGACSPGTPGTESCNGVDDDCNGTADDGVLPLTCGVGACANTALACLPDAGMNVCVPAPPSVETCNNADDDCDGVRDEQADGGALTRLCYNGPASTKNIGRCVEGSQTCAAGSFGTCVGEVLPTAETCNNFDENCNGASDEQADGGPLRQACYTGPAGTVNVGRCVGGTQNCSGGSYTGACNGQVVPAASETCGNAIDDNCNAQVDEACDGGPCDVNGPWRVTGTVPAYSCAFGFVNFNISQVTMATNVPSAGTMTVQPQFTWSPGPSLPLTGPNASCPSGAMDVSVLYAGTCNEFYRLQGSFTGPNSFTGTFTATYTPNGGSCLGCANQTRSITLVRP